MVRTGQAIAVADLMFGLDTIVYIVSTVVVAALAAYLKGRWDKGKKVAQEKAQQRLDAIEDKKEIDDEVRSLPDDDLDRRFDRWLSDDRG